MPVTAGLHYFLHDGGKPTRPPLVLIHGAGGDLLSWPPELRGLSNARVFTLDLPGHGKSAGTGCQSIDDYTKRVIDFIDAIGFSRAVFVGHAMGGAIALTLALDHPDRVAGIGLISCGPRLPITPSILDNASNLATFLQAVHSFQELMHITPNATNLKAQTLDRLASVRQTLFLGDLLACDQFDVSARMGSIKTPVLVVCGTEDELTPQHFSDSLAGKIPGAALQRIDGAGHLVMLERPRRVAGLISIFLLTIPYIPGY